MNRFRPARRGFTIIEVTVVVIILALLATMMIPRFGGTGKRQFRHTAEQVADLMVMFAQREQLQRNPVGIRYDTERHALELVILDSDPQTRVPGSRWVVDAYVTPIRLPERVEIVDVRADDDSVTIADWPLATTPGAERPKIEITLADDVYVATVKLPGHAIAPQITGLDERRNEVNWESVDLDSAGRSREEW